MMQISFITHLSVHLIENYPCWDNTCQELDDKGCCSERNPTHRFLQTAGKYYLSLTVAKIERLRKVHCITHSIRTLFILPLSNQLQSTKV